MCKVKSENSSSCRFVRRQKKTRAKCSRTFLSKNYLFCILSNDPRLVHLPLKIVTQLQWCSRWAPAAFGLCSCSWMFLTLQRPTAKELLKHKFITRYTKKTAYLTELIDRYRRWKSEGHGEESSSDDSDMFVPTTCLFLLDLWIKTTDWIYICALSKQCFEKIVQFY